MSCRSNNHGRAFEYVCVQTLYEKIAQIRACRITKNSSLQADKRAFDTLDNDTKALLAKGAEAIVPTLLELEPFISLDEGDTLDLTIQADNLGETGDVRDILIGRSGVHWEIGLSVKHNHFAVKHSRLARTLDFGEKWFGEPCSCDYWNEVKPIFDMLTQEKAKGTRWSELPEKSEKIYVPLLTAFVKEVKRQYTKDKKIVSKMVEYLLGKYDFYKVISLEQRQITLLQSFNFKGTLNAHSPHSVTTILPRVSLPTQIISLDFKQGSKTTVELYLNEGWQFSFRLHNASTVAEPSLKFDVQIIGLPVTAMTITCHWR